MKITRISQEELKKFTYNYSTSQIDKKERSKCSSEGFHERSSRGNCISKKDKKSKQDKMLNSKESRCNPIMQASIQSKKSIVSSTGLGLGLVLLVLVLVAFAPSGGDAFPAINIFKHRYPMYGGGGFGGYGGYGGISLGSGFGSWGR